MGDLNATAGDPAVARLLAGGLRDTLAALGERGPQAATHHGWDGSTDGTRIDFVLADHDGTSWPPASTTSVPADACHPTTGRWWPTWR